MQSIVGFLSHISRKLFLFCLFFAPFFFLSCQSTSTPQSEKKLIVCTTAYVADLVSHAVGNQAEVVSLMGPGTDPHLYKAGQRDISLLRQADLVVYNGLRLEGKMEDVLKKIEQQKPCFAVTQSLTSAELLFTDSSQSVVDPHVWFSIPIWIKCLEQCQTYLTEKSDVLGLDTATLNTNCTTYKTELSTLHQNALTEFNKIPVENRILVTAHDAFGYFGNTYNLTLKSLQGMSTLSEFSLKDKNDLVDFITQKGITVIYTESSIPPQSIESVIEACKIQGWQVSKGDALYSDAMGNADTPEATYTGVFTHNLNAILKGLQNG